MAAYMRKTGILPVCTNNEARAYFADALPRLKHWSK